MIAAWVVLVSLGQVHAAESGSVIDVHFSGGVVVPVEHTGSVSVGAVSIGTWVKDDLAVRLRMLGSTPPVPESGVVSDAWTWGMMVELQKSWGLSARLDPFWTISSGFVASDRSGDDSKNFATVAMHGGLGFAARLTTSDGPGGWTLSPVIGVAPRLFAKDQLVDFVGPTAEVRLGYAW